MKAIKPSEYLGHQDNLQKFVDYILYVGLPECREFALSLTTPEVTSDGGFIPQYVEEDAQGGISFAQMGLKNVYDEIMEAIAKSIRVSLEHSGVPVDTVMKWSVSRRVAGASEIIAALCDMTEYLVPGEKIVISAVNQILFGGDDTLSGPFGHVFADAMRSIMIKADSIAEEIVQNHNDSKEAVA